jgi:hypothetical protein
MGDFKVQPDFRQYFLCFVHATNRLCGVGFSTVTTFVVLATVIAEILRCNIMGVQKVFVAQICKRLSILHTKSHKNL